MDNNVLQVKDLTSLEALQNHTDGEVAFVEDIQEYRIWVNEQWMPVQAKIDDENGLQINLYELNKQIISQLSNFEDEQWENAKEVFNEWIKAIGGEYHMLYGREINYFTVFKSKEYSEFETMFDALKSCLDFVGNVRAMDITEDGNSIEIWVENNGAVTCMYLFNYDGGIVTYAK